MNQNKEKYKKKEYIFGHSVTKILHKMALVGNLLSSPGRPAVCTDCRFQSF